MVGTAGVVGDHDALDGRQVSVDLGPERLQLALEALQLALDVDLPLGADALQIVDLTLQLEERLLELQRVG